MSDNNPIIEEAVAMRRNSLLLCVAVVQCIACGVLHADEPVLPGVRNLIVMIPDGMSSGGLALARWFKGGDALAMDALACGLVRTHSAGSAITDSAAAGTAFASGFKTDNEMLGVMAREPDMPGLDPAVYRKEFARTPVANIMEAARLKGLATGLVVTCSSTEATPAAFSAHFPDRDAAETIIEQQVYCGLDLFLGAGDKFLKGGARKDKEDLVSELRRMGYEYLETRDQMMASAGTRLWASFGEDSIAYEIDRTDVQPSLAEMTAKALSVLSKKDKGFLLMVEGSKIDWAAHSNEPVGLISDILSFDKAVEEALRFARADGGTAIIIMSDHGNGGVNIGTRGSMAGNHPGEFLPALKRAKRSGQTVASMLLPSMGDAEIRAVVSENYGIKDLSADEVARLKGLLPSAGNKKIRTALGEMMSRRSNIGWVHDNHTAEDVVLFMFHPGGTKAMGVIDNTDVAKIACVLLSLDLRSANSVFFRDAVAEFSRSGAQVSVGGKEAGNAVLRVKGGASEIEFPEAKNFAVSGGRKIMYSHGQNIRIGEKWHLPAEAIGLVGGAKAQ